MATSTAAYPGAFPETGPLTTTSAAAAFMRVLRMAGTSFVKILETFNVGSAVLFFAPLLWKGKYKYLGVLICAKRCTKDIQRPLAS